MLIAHVLNNKAHYIFDAPSLPVVPDCPAGLDQLFAPLVPTNAKEGWIYTPATGIFSPPTNYVAPPVPNFDEYNYLEYITSGQFKVPEGVTKILITACGGGGGGGAGYSSTGSQTGQGGMGGGGSPGIYRYEANVTPGQTINITLGTGGMGGIFAGANSGVTATNARTGGASVISGVITLSGGAGAAANTLRGFNVSNGWQSGRGPDGIAGGGGYGGIGRGFAPQCTGGGGSLGGGGGGGGGYDSGAGSNVQVVNNYMGGFGLVSKGGDSQMPGGSPCGGQPGYGAPMTQSGSTYSQGSYGGGGGGAGAGGGGTGSAEAHYASLGGQGGYGYCKIEWATP